MKNTFITAMFIFWGFVVAVVSASYVVKQNRLAQEQMQKTYTESLQQIVNTVTKSKGGQSSSVTVEAVNQKPVATNSGTVVTPAPTPKPIPVSTSKPVTPAGPTLTDVALHNTESDCWIIISSKVYSVASYIPLHPGGRRKILNVCGGNATSPYDRQGHSSYADSLLGQYLVGTLQ